MNRKKFITLLAGGRKGIQTLYSLRCLFPTNQSAPISSPYTEGTGDLTIVDTGNRASITGEKMRFNMTTGTNWGNPGAWGGSQSRLTGKAFLFEIKNSGRAMCGFDTNQASTLDENALHFDATGLNARVGGVSLPVETVSTSATYKGAIVLRTNGAFYVLDGKLIWVDASRNTANCYPAFVAGDLGARVADFDYISVTDLSAPWSDDFGVATQVLSGARESGDTFAHEPNCLVEFTVTTRPSDLLDLRFRVVDASNYLQVTVSSSGELTLNEVVAGITTQLATKAAGVAPGNRVVIIADESTIRVNPPVSANCIVGNSSNFLSATNGVLTTEGTGGAVTTIISWPYDLSGAALSEVDKNFT